jgi:hypothetical protein
MNGENLISVYQGKLEQEREYTFPVNLSNHPSGTYLIKITGSNFSQSLKLSKVR